MATDPSKNTEQHQNTEENNEELSYSAIAAALESNDAQAVSRLLAAEESDESEQDQNGDSTPKADEPDAQEDDSSQEGEQSEANPEAAGATPAAPAAQTDDELRRELHRVKSELGRVPAMQRQLMQLQAELRAARDAARGSSSNANPNKTTESNVPADELPADIKRRLDTLREVDPEIADAMEAVYKQSRSAVDPAAIRAEILSEVEARRQEDEDQRFFQEQLSELGRLVPQYQEVFSHPEWARWKDTLTPTLRALAESPYASEVAMAIQGFAHHMQATMNNQGTHQNPSAASSGGGDPNASTNAAASGNSQVAAARSRKVDASPAVKSTAAKADSNVDTSAQFSEFYSNKMKELGLSK